MKERKVKVAIIGAGSAGLSARREVAKVTDDYVVIDDGPLGTTCARVGCMPSKVLIQVANDFYRRESFAGTGIHGGEALNIDGREVMEHVRSLRDRFVRGVMSGMASWMDTHLIRGRARFEDMNTLVVGDLRLTAERVIIAVGSRPVMLKAWEPVQHLLFDTDAIFELENLPKSVAVVGLGVIGLELGQALHRLGVEVQCFTLDKALGGLTDPALQEYTFRALASEFPIHLKAIESLEEKEGKLVVHVEGASFRVDAGFLAIGRKPNVDRLGVEALGLPLTERGGLHFDSGTYGVPDSPHFYVGDVNGARPLLHEASDEGRIAGFNAVRSEAHCFQRRIPLAITFCDPNIASVGETFRELESRGEDYVVGTVTWEGQGRAIVKRKERGLMHLYACRETGLFLGAELFAPGAEHMAHLLAWAKASGMTVREMLAMPFYHPVVEEGLRTALRDVASQLMAPEGSLEMLRCEEPPVGCWS